MPSNHTLSNSITLYYFKFILSFIAVIINSCQICSGDTQNTKKGKNKNQKFEMKLTIEHGHIGHVFIGCESGATDDFDRQLDDMAPPPGMGGVGYTFLVSPNRKYNLYRDIRGFSDTVQWLFFAKTGNQPVKLSWDKDSVPKGWNMYCSPGEDGARETSDIYDCRKTTSIEITKTGFFRFWIKLQESPM